MALVGAGFIAGVHAEALREVDGVEVVLVCDPDLGRAQDLARRFGIPRAIASVDGIAAGEVDVAHLLVPPDLHEALARTLLERGIGVFAEKPLALSAAAARALAELARARGRPLGVDHNFVFHPAFARLLAEVRGGRIGRVEHVRATLATPLAQLESRAFGHWMFQAPANALYEQGVHAFSLVHALAGRVLEGSASILASRELAPGQVFPSRWSIAAEAERATAEVHLSFGSTFERFAVEVRGSDGFLEADLRRDALSGEGKSAWLEFYDAYLALSRRGRSLRAAARRGLYAYLLAAVGLARRKDGYFASVRDAIRDFHGNGSGGGSGAEAAAEVLEWCDLAAQAAPPAPPVAAASDPGPARPGEIAVLGAGGFIGRRTVLKLLERGLPVTAVVRGGGRLPAELAASSSSGGVRVVRARLEDRASLERALSGAKVVLQLATGSTETFEAARRTGVEGSVAAAEAALQGGAARFVYVSSIAALDTRGDRPIEDGLATDARPEDRSPYARAKIAAERALVAMHESAGLPLVIARPGVVLGAGAPFQHSGLGQWVRDNHCVGWGAGAHALPLVWVDDVADALAAIAAFPGRELDGRAVDLAASTGLSAVEVVGELRKATGRDLRFHARSIGLSWAMELGKWLVKRIGGREAERPTLRDLQARALAAPIPSRTARELLGWKPVEEREAFLDRAVRVHARDR